MDAPAPDPAFRSAVRTVALANLTYFFVEFAAARIAGSVSLFADSIDFLEDAAVNILILLALDWPAGQRAKVGMGLAALLLAPSLAALWTVWQKVSEQVPPNTAILSLAGLGALGVNLFCAFLLARFRRTQGSLAKAAFLSARNDALANLAIIAAGLATIVFPSIWPDVVVGLAIAAMNAGAAREVWEAAHKEHNAAP